MDRILGRCPGTPQDTDLLTMINMSEALRIANAFGGELLTLRNVADIMTHAQNTIEHDDLYASLREPIVGEGGYEWLNGRVSVKNGKEGFVKYHYTSPEELNAQAVFDLRNKVMPTNLTLSHDNYINWANEAGLYEGPAPEGEGDLSYTMSWRHRDGVIFGTHNGKAQIDGTIPWNNASWERGMRLVYLENSEKGKALARPQEETVIDHNCGDYMVSYPGDMGKACALCGKKS